MSHLPVRLLLGEIPPDAPTEDKVLNFQGFLLSQKP